MEFPAMPPVENNVDWEYVMRREMQEIVPNLFLGPYASANKTKLLQLESNNITDIVCVRHVAEANFIKPNFPNNFRYLVLDIADTSTENIIQYLPKVKAFLDDCFMRGGRALVHGNAGISRSMVIVNHMREHNTQNSCTCESASLVIGYLMEKYGITFREAFLYVNRQRFCINPNEGFVQQLIEYEPIYQARQSMQNSPITLDSGKLKRKFSEDHTEISHHHDDQTMNDLPT